jgi:hypothetical protein
MRPFVIASVAFILALSVNTKDVSKTDSEQNKPGNTQASPEHTSTQIEINVGNPSNSTPPQPLEQQAVAKAKSAPISNGEWLIAVITAVYVVITYLSFKAIKKQANIAQDTINALIAGQRAWVMVDIEFNPTGVVVTSMRGETQIHSIQVKMNYRNDGQTPAWITERRARLFVLTDNTIPEFPDLSKADAIAHGTIPLSVGQRHGYGNVDTPLECPADYSPDAIHLIYGEVRYRTAFNGAGETIFGYRVTRGWDRLERLESPEWNKNT